MKNITRMIFLLALLEKMQEMILHFFVKYFV